MLLTGIIFLFKCLHLLGVGHLFNWLSSFKSSVRKLTAAEVALAKTVYGESIDYSRVRVDERAWLGPRQFHFAYVSLNMINTYGPISAAHFIHEMMHIWQYQHLGIRYIPLALYAQHFGQGYDYGGEQALRKAVAEGKDIRSFNYEQQAEIVADYFRLMHGLPGKYLPKHTDAYPLLASLVRAVRESPSAKVA